MVEVILLYCHTILRKKALLSVSFLFHFWEVILPHAMRCLKCHHHLCPLQQLLLHILFLWTLTAGFGLAYTCIVTHFLTLHAYGLAGWTCILAKMYLLTTPVESSLPLLPFLLFGRLWRWFQGTCAPIGLAWRLTASIDRATSCTFWRVRFSSQFWRSTFINNLISDVNIWVRKITILCLLPKPSHELTNCLSLLLSHIREYMPLIQFVKLGDKIRVQST